MKKKKKKYGQNERLPFKEKEILHMCKIKCVSLSAVTEKKKNNNSV